METDEFELDTLQLFFPWDDDFYTVLKNDGFGKSGLGAKTLPLIYTDNTERTVGKKELKRKFVIRPELFGKSYSGLGWKETYKRNEPIISAEKPKIKVILGAKQITFKIVPRVNGKNQYHIEYSSMAAFGKMYSNWAIIYLSIEEMKKLINFLKKELDKNKTCFQDLILKTESKQNQREEIDYVEVPINYYEFSLGEFEHAKDFLKLNGYKKKDVPSLVYDSKDKKAREVMEPIAKVGILHTTDKEGFMKRDPQFVIKLSQNKITLSQRGKKAKVKGIVKDANNENKFILDSKTFFCALLKLTEKFKEKHNDIKLI